MHPTTCLSVFLFTSMVVAQVPELSVNNSFRVVSNSKHLGTNRNYPAAATYPASYATAPGIAAGARTFTYTPRLRTQGGAEQNWWTVTGMTQAIFVGAAVANFPAPNHYQFACGIAATEPSTRAGILQHHRTAADVLFVAQAPLAINAGGIYEHNFNLTTPVRLAETELCMFVQYQGGEWIDDPNGGQLVGSDYQGGNSPSGVLMYQGHTTGNSPRTVALYTSYYRPKIGLLVNEAVLTSTGYHANGYYTAPLANESYRGLGACAADWRNAANGTLFFDMRAGANYAGGNAVVILNIGTFFPSRFPTQWGNLMVDPTSPAFGALTSLVMPLGTNGEYDQGLNAPIPVPALGSVAVGQILKAQGAVLNATNGGLKLTSASAIQIY